MIHDTTIMQALEAEIVVKRRLFSVRRPWVDWNVSFRVTDWSVGFNVAVFFDQDLNSSGNTDVKMVETVSIAAALDTTMTPSTVDVRDVLDSIVTVAAIEVVEVVLERGSVDLLAVWSLIT